jgi:hypothetical protein
MSGNFISVSIPIADVIHDLDIELALNELGREYGTRENALSFLERIMGSELDDHGKAFLFALADFSDRQFPGER